VSSAFLESRGYGAEAFDVVKEDLDAVTFAVLSAVKSRLFSATGMGADDRLHLLGTNLRDNLVRVVGRICNDRFTLCVMGNYLFGYRTVMLLTRREFEVKRAALGVDERVDLG